MVKAAKTIRGAYLHHLDRKNVVRKGIDATQARYWHLLRKRSMEMEWSEDSRYYLLFRVPLARILACLEVIGAFIGSKKKEVEKWMMTEGHRDLERQIRALQQYRYDGFD